METPERQMGEIQKQLVGSVKRCFINTKDNYTVCTEYFHYKNNFYNYISVEEHSKGSFHLILGLWLENLNGFLSKLYAVDLNGDEVLNIVREISADFR